LSINHYAFYPLTGWQLYILSTHPATTCSLEHWTLSRSGYVSEACLVLYLTTCKHQYIRPNITVWGKLQWLEF